VTAGAAVSFQTPPDPPPVTLFDAWLRSGAPWQPLGVVHDAWRCTDAAGAAFAMALEWQQALWQPWWDAQAEWLRQWGAAWPASLPAERGGEQLA
jgi:hypothetical protein